MSTKGTVTINKAPKRATTCHVAGILKGLIEFDDPFANFGTNTAVFTVHAEEAIRVGVVDGDPKNSSSLKPTALGIRLYNEWGLKEAPTGRAYMWPWQVYALP